MCAVAGGFLHYFFLVTFFLMAAEAINLYTKLVIVLGIPSFIKNRYVLKASLISWSESHCTTVTVAVVDSPFLSIVVPLFIVIASMAPNWRNYVRDEM